MRAGNQKRSEERGRQDEGTRLGARETLQSVGQGLQERAGEMGEQLREGFDSGRAELKRRYRSVEGVLARNPRSSVLLGLGLGFGVGLVITSLLGERHRETWSERHLPDPLRHLPETLEQLADSARQLPEALRSRVASAISGR
jgi:hypothetical protein